LIKALADLETQTPQSNVVWNIRITSRTKQDGIFRAQWIKTILGHHHAVLAVVITAPIKVLKLKSHLRMFLAQGVEHLLAFGNNFFTNSVTWNGSDLVRLHWSPTVLFV
jgi:menaquinone-dependent protoporphyrinogen IX oxidase